MSNSDLASETAGREGRASEAKDEATEAATGGEEKEVRLNVEVPESRRERLKARCEAEGRTLKYVLNELVEHYASGGDLP